MLPKPRLIWKFPSPNYTKRNIPSTWYSVCHNISTIGSLLDLNRLVLCWISTNWFIAGFRVHAHLEYVALGLVGIDQLLQHVAFVQAKASRQILMDTCGKHTHTHMTHRSMTRRRTPRLQFGPKTPPQNHEARCYLNEAVAARYPYMLGNFC